MTAVRPHYLDPRNLPREGVLAVVAFGAKPPETAGLRVSVPIPQIDGSLVEVWTAGGTVVRGERHDVAFARTVDVLFGTIRVNDTSADSAARRAYDAIVDVCRDQEMPHLWRIWNHVGGINEDDGGLERYKRFSMGRHESLSARGYAREQFPAASAVGMSEPGLVVYFVAGRSAGRQIENPRQISAYDYPPQYGPKSPSFSRATVVGDDLIFLSGTASVVGHESRHGGSTERQLSETIENMDVTLSAAAALAGRSASTRDLAATKIYVRRGSFDSKLRKGLREAFSSSIVLESDICRRELLLEIEGVAVLSRT